jgi:hypothetical protein
LRSQLDPSDRNLYVYVKALSANESHLSFETVKTPVPQPLPDYSNMAWVAQWVLVASILAIIVIKSLEKFEWYLQYRQKIDHENLQFQKRLGIDFRVDRERLEALALATRRNFSNDCLTNKSLFRFKGTKASALEKELAKRDIQD